MSDEATNVEPSPATDEATLHAAAESPVEGSAAEPSPEAQDDAREHESSAGARAAEEPDEDLPARGADPRPFIVLTAIHDANARIAAITLSHADAWERAQKAIGDRSIAGVDLVELSVPPRAFTALREKLQRAPSRRIWVAPRARVRGSSSRPRSSGRSRSRAFCLAFRSTSASRSPGAGVTARPRPCTRS
jgi:hypothetical protein